MGCRMSMLHGLLPGLVSQELCCCRHLWLLCHHLLQLLSLLLLLTL